MVLINRAGRAYYSTTLKKNNYSCYINVSLKLYSNHNGTTIFGKKIDFPLLLVPPHILPLDFGEDAVNYGEFASLTCSVHKGDLPINISWLHNNKSIGYIDGLSISKAGKKVSTITIDSVEASHAGTFTCVAANKAGEAYYNAILNVNGKRLNI